MNLSSILSDLRKSLFERLRNGRSGSWNGEAAYEALKLEHAALETQVREHSLHSQEMALFSQLAEMLQACDSAQELCTTVAIFAKDLFPEDAGALHILEPAHLSLNTLVAWGEPPPPIPAFFRPHDCRSIHKGKTLYQEHPNKDAFCAHLSGPLPAFTFCLPLVGQGGNLGLLHLRSGASGALMAEPRQLVAIALAHQAALGLSILRLKELLRAETIRDPVTGLYNRRFMRESLDHEIRRAERNGTSVGVILLNLDRFKEVNDSLGQAAGDAMLQGLAKLVMGSLRGVDVPCRQGGDEFLMILPDSSEDGALTLAESLRKKAERFAHDRFSRMPGRVTLSAGVALFPQDASTAEGLRNAAAQALRRAKTLGRDRVCAASGSNEGFHSFPRELILKD